MTLPLEPEERAPCGITGLIAVCNASFVFREMPPDLSDCLVARPKPFRLIIWEPLLTKAPAPPKAKPYCCYIRSVIFYHHPYIVWPFGGYWRDAGGALRKPMTRGFLEWDHVKARLSWDDIVSFEGENFKVGSGRVVWKRGRWWMLHYARREARP